MSLYKYIYIQVYVCVSTACTSIIRLRIAVQFNVSSYPPFYNVCQPSVFLLFIIIPVDILMDYAIMRFWSSLLINIRGITPGDEHCCDYSNERNSVHWLQQRGI